MSVLKTVLDDAGLEPRSYSGRGMHGRECLGVDVGRGDIGLIVATIVAATDDDNREELMDAVRNIATDAMGRGTIVYFPDVAFEDER